MKRTDTHHSTFSNIRGKVSRSAFEYQLRLWLVAFSRGLFWGSLVIVLIRFLAVWSALTLSFEDSLWLSALVAVAPVILTAIRIISIRRDPNWRVLLWHQLDDSLIAESLLSAYELNKTLYDPAVPAVTKTFIRKQQEDCWRDFQEISPQHLRKPIFERHILAGLVVVVAVGFMGQRVSPDFWGHNVRTQNRVEAPSSWVKGLTLKITPPDYTGLPPKLLKNTDGSLEVYEGSRITGTAVSLRRDISLGVEVPGHKPVPLSPSSGRVEIGFDAVETGPWRFFGLERADEDPVYETQRRLLTLIPDETPTISMKSPSQDRVVTRDELLQLVYETEDDFGLVETFVVLSIDGDTGDAQRQQFDKLQHKKYRGAGELDLSMFDVQDGERIALHLEALDNRKPEPQIGRSKAVYLTIESKEADHQRLTIQLKELLEPYLDRLADRLELETSKRWLTERNALILRERELRQETESLFDGLAQDELTPREVVALLKVRLKSFETALDAERKELDRHLSTVQKEPETAKRSARVLIQSVEKMIIAIEASVARLSMEDMKALTEQIRVRKERLSDLLNAYRESPSDQLKRRIMRNVNRLKQKMRELRERMAQLQQKLPEEFLNLDGLKGSEMSESMKSSAKSLDDIENLLNEGKIDEALDALENLSESLDELGALVDKDMETMHRENDPETQKMISEMMDSARDLMKQQNNLLDKTNQLQAEGQKELEALLAQRAEELKEIDELLEGATEKADSLRKESQSMNRSQVLDRLSRQSVASRDALKMSDLSKASERADEAMEASRQLTWDQRSENHEQDRKVYGMLTDASKKLRKLLEDARQSQQTAERMKKSRGLGEEQQMLTEELRQLQQTVEESAQQIPGLQEGAQSMLSEASNAMRSAKESLESSKPGRAASAESEALNSLEKTIKALRKAARPSPAPRNSRQRTSDEKVEIPSGEDFEAPLEFREELLRAMKGKTDELNEEAVKRYYRSLVE